MSQHLTEVSRALRNAQRRKRRMEASQKLQDAAIDFHRMVAVHLCQRCEGRTEVAVDYLAKKGCHREGGQPWTSEDVLEWSQTISAEPSTDTDVISAEPSASTELKAAQQFLLESRVYDWVRHQNVAKGLTPMMKTFLRNTSDSRRIPVPRPGPHHCRRLLAADGSGGSDGHAVGMFLTVSSRLACACHWSSGEPRQH